MAEVREKRPWYRFHAVSLTMLFGLAGWTAWDLAPDVRWFGFFNPLVFPHFLIASSFLIVLVLLLEGVIRFRARTRNPRKRRRRSAAMAAPRKRPAWLQLRLSTCIVLMFVAGLLIGANLRGDGVLTVHMKSMEGATQEAAWRKFGWPLIYHSEYRSGPRSHYYHANTVLAENVAVAVVILVGCALVLEYLARRRAETKDRLTQGRRDTELQRAQHEGSGSQAARAALTSSDE